MADRNAHLVERVAARLRGTAGLAPPDPTAAPHAAQVVPLTVASPLPSPLSSPLSSQAAAAAAIADYVEPDFVPDDAAELDIRGDMPLGEPPIEARLDPGARRPGPARPELPAGAPFLDMAALKRGGLALAGVRSRVTEEYRITVGRILRALRSANRTGPGRPTWSWSRPPDRVKARASPPSTSPSASRKTGWPKCCWWTWMPSRARCPPCWACASGPVCSIWSTSPICAPRICWCAPPSRGFR
jgi:hypothetical protein